MKLVIMLITLLSLNSMFAIKIRSKALGFQASVSKDSCKRAIAVAPLCLLGPAGGVAACAILATGADKKNNIPICHQVKQCMDYLDEKNIPSKIIQAPLKYLADLFEIRECSEYYSSNPDTDYRDTQAVYNWAEKLPPKEIDIWKLVNAPIQEDMWSCGLNCGNRLLMHAGFPDLYKELKRATPLCTVGIGNKKVPLGPPPQILVKVLNSIYNKHQYLSGTPIDLVMNLLKSGRPVIALISIDSITLHYITLTGIEVQDGQIMVRYVDTSASATSAIQRKEMTLERFLHKWSLKDVSNRIRKIMPLHGQSIIFQY